MQYCSKCVYPIAAVNLILDDDGVCAACGVSDEYQAITDEEWQRRLRSLHQTRACAYQFRSGKMGERSGRARRRRDLLKLD